MSVNIKNGRRTVIAVPNWYPGPGRTERAVVFQPGYNDDPRGDPRKDYGVHGMEIAWYLRGPRGGAQFKVYTEWIPGKLYPGHGLMPLGYPQRPPAQRPMGADVGYHARVSQWDGQEIMQDDCGIIGGPCFYDGSGMAAERLSEEFVELGEPIIWARLEAIYTDLKMETPRPPASGGG